MGKWLTLKKKLVSHVSGVWYGANDITLETGDLEGTKCLGSLSIYVFPIKLSFGIIVTLLA